MNTYKCNKVKRFLFKLSHRQVCTKKENENKVMRENLSVKEEEDLPLFIKNKSGRWINRKTGKFVKKEVAEAYANHKC